MPAQGVARFLLDAPLGEGGFCSVYRAKDLATGTIVALKVLRPETDTPKNREALRHEYQVLSRVRHPNLVDVIEFCQDSTYGACLVLEPIEGSSLRCFFNEASEEEQVESIVQLCRALNFLHARSLVHGDIKPDNVLIARIPATHVELPRDHPTLTVKLLDLGFATQSREGHPLPRRGTPSYVAPEILAGMPADHRADLYSLGVLILESLLPPSILTSALDPSNPKALAQGISSLPTFLGAVAKTLLHHDPGRRPATASDVIETFSELMGKCIPFETPEGVRASLRSIAVIGRNQIRDEIVASCAQDLSPNASGSLTEPSVYLIHGEAGIGKSVLLDEIAKTLRMFGIRHHRTFCTDNGASPFHPFKAFLNDQDDDLSDRLAENGAGDSLSPGWGPYDRANRLEQVTQRLAKRLASYSGTIIIEDLQVADEESFEVFLRLVSRARSGGFRLVASFRTEGLLAGRLERLIEGHFAAPHVRSIRLQRLNPEETEEVLRSCLGPLREASRVAGAIHRISEGNPLFLIELLRGLIEGGQITGGPFRWKIDAASIAASGAPRGLRDLVRRRLADIPEDAYQLLGWLSVLGEPAGLSLLHEASGLPYAELRRHEASLEAIGLIHHEESRSEAPSWFTHELYRTCVYESLPAARRQQMHRSVGVAFERLWGERSVEKVAALAHHFIRGGDSQKGPRYAVSAGERARDGGALHQAISLYHEALTLIQGDQIDLRYEVLEILAGLLRQVGEPVRSESYYYEMLLAARARSDTLREAIALTQIGRIQADRGKLSEAEAFARRALEKHDLLQNPTGRAEALLVLAMISNKSADNSAAVRFSTEAKLVSKMTGCSRLHGLASNIMGMALTSMRRYEEALPEFTAWLGVAEETHDIIAQTIALSNIGWVHLERGQLDESESYFSRCLLRAVEEGLVLTAGLAGINSSEVARLRGSFASSRERARAALATTQRAERSEGIQYCIYTLGLLDLEEGALGEAKANLIRALGMSEEVGAKGSAALTLVAVGDMHIHLGDFAGAGSAFSRAAETGLAVGDDLIRCLALSGQAEAEARSRLENRPPALLESGGMAPCGVRSATAAGSPDERSVAGNATAPACSSTKPMNEQTVNLASEAFAIADRIESPQARVRADLAGAMACLSVGALEVGLRLAKRAGSEADKGGLRPGKARASLVEGMIHARAGRRNEAEAALREACTMADEMGLASVRAESRAEMAEIAAVANEAARADELYIQAANIIQTMASSLPEPSERDLFLSVGWRKLSLTRAEEARRRDKPAGLRSAEAGRDMQAPVAGYGSSPTSIDTVASGPASAGGQSSIIRTADGVPSSGDGLPIDGHPDPASPASGHSGAAQGTPPRTDPGLPDPDLRTGVARLLDEALKTTGGDRGLLFLIGPDGGSEIAVARGLESESIDDARSYCRSVIDRAAQGEEILAVDTSRDERFRDRRSVSLFQIVSIICVPLKIGPRVMGALYLDSRAGGRLLRDEDFRRARDVASRIAGSIRAAWETERRREEHLLKQRTLCQTYRLDAIVGESAAMRKIFRVLEAVIASDCNVLVVGESGTGKELAARAIHFSGRRKLAPFVPLDCGALQDSLVESELFGYRKGAFTGADMDRQGLFEEADGGTLFLDEITNTSMLFQGKLLRVLQSGEFRRVGDSVARRVDVRIIAATNADLEETIRSGKFREDLYYRLNVVTVRMPPLRERPEDIPALAEQFAKAYCQKEKISYRGVGDSALRRLCEHGWPGNVRELKNAIESALVLSRDGAVRREFLPEPVRGGSFEEIRALLKAGAVDLAGGDAVPATDSHESTGLETAGQTSPSTRTVEGGEEHLSGPGRAASATQPRHFLPQANESSGDRSSDSVRRVGPPGWMTEAESRALGDEGERSRIEDALRTTGGDKSRAAGVLGWSRMTLYRKMRRLGIDYTTGRNEGPSPSDKTEPGYDSQERTQELISDRKDPSLTD